MNQSAPIDDPVNESAVGDYLAQLWPAVMPWPPTDDVIRWMQVQAQPRGYQPFVPQLRLMGRPLFLMPDVTMFLMCWLSGNLPSIDLTHEAQLR